MRRTMACRVLTKQGRRRELRSANVLADDFVKNHRGAMRRVGAQCARNKGASGRSYSFRSYKMPSALSSVFEHGRETRFSQYIHGTIRSFGFQGTHSLDSFDDVTSCGFGDKVKIKTSSLGGRWTPTSQCGCLVHAMARQLQKKDLQLKALDAFYKEQLAQLEKRVRIDTFSSLDLSSKASKVLECCKTRKTLFASPLCDANIKVCREPVRSMLPCWVCTDDTSRSNISSKQRVGILQHYVIAYQNQKGVIDPQRKSAENESYLLTLRKKKLSVMKNDSLRWKAGDFQRKTASQNCDKKLSEAHSSCHKDIPPFAVHDCVQQFRLQQMEMVPMQLLSYRREPADQPWMTSGRKRIKMQEKQSGVRAESVTYGTVLALISD
ncbi:hypothetical protein F2P81_011994 [Scophthalmus maximus]|uniref:Uncharacterized protein n=1 Tax=Scophthalmus maximus TaxID=52904 RepID=A0A6A4T3D7_SCOMX|nr:hypothetical protein F2P81_011994 [Scophthalmus maximus]